MSDIKPKYFEHPDFLIRHLEWSALLCIVYKKDMRKIEEAMPNYNQRPYYWQDYFTDKAKEKHHQLRIKLHTKEILTMEEFYKALDKFLKPKPLGKALKDKKKRTAQSTYQQERLGNAFIDNKVLLSQAKQSAFQLAEDNADKDMITARANELIKEYSNDSLSREQQNTLINYIEAQVNKHLKLDKVEASIIDEDNKNIYFMWGKIKRRYVKGDTFVWTNDVATKAAHCSKSEVGKIMNKLEKLGAITCIQKGKRGSFSRRANLYRREI